MVLHPPFIKGGIPDNRIKRLKEKDAQEKEAEAAAKQ
jgi:hypothetical protein